jgi:periplasmic protein TonB
MFHRAAHNLVSSISVASILAVLGAPAFAQTPEPEAHPNLPNLSTPPHLWPRGAPNEWDLDRTRWERSLSAHLERFKHYPRDAVEVFTGDKNPRHKILCGQEGGDTVVVLRIDRQGHVLKSRIVRSSGASALDQETLAMIKRADPLPAPPNGLPDTALTIRVPIHYRNGCRAILLPQNR